MGSGAARSLDAGGEKRSLEATLSTKLKAALQKLDAADPSFKTNRDDERFSQQVKMWNGMCKEIEDHLRGVGDSIYRAHQISLEIGIEGGGGNARPWTEDGSRKFERLTFRLVNGEVHAVAGTTNHARVPMEEISYEWVEQAVVAWLVHAVEVKTRG